MSDAHLLECRCACVFAEPGTVNVTVTTCPGKGVRLASTNAIVTLCWPGGSPAMSTVLLSLASAHHQGRSSSVMCRCPTLGDTLSAPALRAAGALQRVVAGLGG